MGKVWDLDLIITSVIFKSLLYSIYSYMIFFAKMQVLVLVKVMFVMSLNSF